MREIREFIPIVMASFEAETFSFVLRQRDLLKTRGLASWRLLQGIGPARRNPQHKLISGAEASAGARMTGTRTIAGFFSDFVRELQTACVL